MAASEWKERQQRLDKEKGFFRQFGACSVSLVGKNHGIRNIVWLFSESWGWKFSSLRALGQVRDSVFFPWHRCLESSQCQDVLLLPVFPTATMTETASYCTSSRCTFLLVNTFLLFLNSKQLFGVNRFNLLFQPNWGSRN